MVTRCYLLTICALLVCSHSLADVTLVHDDFDGTTLDPEWHVRLGYDPPASSWEYEVASGVLSVTDVQGYDLASWCSARLRRECAAAGEFSLACDFTWDSDGSPAAMQTLRVSLVDTAGGNLAIVMFYDCWVGARGVMYAGVGSTVFEGTDRLPYAGEASVRIERSGDVISVLWDEETLVTETATAAVESLELAFWYYYRYGSLFGTESVDVVTVTAPETAVEPVSWARIKALSHR